MDIFAKIKELGDGALGVALGIVFVLGYFPVNMILAGVFGDKVDLLMSFFIPFYGLVVFLGS